MAIEVTARIVLTREEWAALGARPSTDEGLAADVQAHLRKALPYGVDRSGLTVGVRRKVKKDSTTRN